MKQASAESVKTQSVLPATTPTGVEQQFSSIDKNVESSVGSLISDAGTKKVVTKKDKKSLFDISGVIAQLLKKKQPPRVATKKQQTEMVLNYLQKEEKTLLKQMKKFSSKKRFSAEKLERFAEKLRYVKSLIDKIIQKTIENIENLYKKYILKESKVAASQ